MNVYVYGAIAAFLLLDVLIIRWFIRRHRKASDPLTTQRDWPYEGHK